MGSDARVLVLAPWGRDAPVICQVLTDGGLDALAVAGMPALLEALGEGAGLAFLTEEALTQPAFHALRHWLTQQPPWSDFPLVVLAARHGQVRPVSAQASLERLGNVVLLERPLHAESLLSAARSALRGRRRQYDIRRHLEEERLAAIETARLLDAERRAQEATRRATEALAFALTAAELGTFHCPLPLSYLDCNATFAAQMWLTGDHSRRLKMDTFYAAVHTDDREDVREQINRASRSRDAFDVEFRTVSNDGQFRWVRAKGMAYGTVGAAATRLDGIMIDISVQKALETQREALLASERGARVQAEHASRMKDEFLATLSHELRTPLAAIIGWTHVLRRAPHAAPGDARAVDTIERNARTQAKLIDDLLDMSRIISGHVRLDVERVELAALAESVLSSLEPTAQAKRLAVRLDLGAPHAGTAVRGDAHRLQQVIWNLVSNAFKFTPTAGTVTIALEGGPSNVVLSVTDSGQGIEPGFLPFVFDRFRQSDASTTRVHGGLGLGLAIVKNLVELHGGTVQAHSDGLGHGARFSIALPAASEDLFDTPPSASPSSGALPSETAHDLAGMSIVVVDDEPDLCELLRHELENCGATVHAAGSAAEALDVLSAQRPDLLISDIGMPDMDGHSLIRQLRARGPGQGGDLPAIALTAFAGPEDRARALAAGFNAHIAKPVDTPELLDRVVALLQASEVAPI